MQITNLTANSSTYEWNDSCPVLPPTGNDRILGLYVQFLSSVRNLGITAEALNFRKEWRGKS